MTDLNHFLEYWMKHKTLYNKIAYKISREMIPNYVHSSE